MESLLYNLVGPEKITRIEKQISGFGGRVIDGVYGEQMYPWSAQQFGEFASKLIGLTKGIDLLSPEKTTAIGGWCPVRTADMNLLKEGLLPDPVTGEIKPITNVSDVSKWLLQAISIDQAIEAIGIYNGTKYFAISEEKLWGNKIKSAVRSCLRRKLSNTEQSEIETALKQAELLRYSITQRYIDYTSQRSNQLSRTSDYDIWDGLIETRDRMLDDAEITMKDLLARYPEDDASTPEYSIVWGMYTGRYLEMLKKKGVVSTPKGIIIEPYFHAVGETGAKAFVVDRLLNEPNNYLVKKGVNRNLGFAAFANVMNSSGQILARYDTIDKVPNVLNYEFFLKQLSTSQSCSSLTLSENAAFMWGVNLLPFGKCRDALVAMVSIKDEYKTARNKIGTGFEAKDDNTKKARSLKEEYSKMMSLQAQIVVEELNKLLITIFN